MPNFSQQKREQSARAIAELMEYLSRALVSRSATRDLSVAQWTALRYLGHASEEARQVGAFARFHMTTPSSASQTIGALVKKGLVVKLPASDGRRWNLKLTLTGQGTLNDDPIIALSERLLSLPDDRLFDLAETMQFLSDPPVESAKVASG